MLDPSQTFPVHLQGRRLAGHEGESVHVVPGEQPTIGPLGLTLGKDALHADQ